MRIEAAVRSDRGRVRKNNEDNFFFAGESMALTHMDAGAALRRTNDDLRQLYAISDGMGGEDAGEEASTMAAALVGELYGVSSLTDDALLSFAEYVNDRVASLRTDGRRAGATLVLAALDLSGLRLLHVGDSRAYRFTQNTLVQCTRDHTEAEQMATMGLLEDTADVRRLGRNALTQHLGMPSGKALIDPCLSEPVPLVPGDLWLLCSDGLTDMLPDAQIEAILAAGGPAEEIVRTLVDAALAAGGRDNITTLVLRVLQAESAADGTRRPATRKEQVIKTAIWAVVAVLILGIALALGIWLGTRFSQGGPPDPGQAAQAYQALCTCLQNALCTI